MLRVGSLENVPFPGPIAVVGTLPAVGPGTRVRLTGDFFKDPRHGEQFRADTLVPLDPATLVGLENTSAPG
ncbi:MAG: hypothetical protein U0263_40280 [Polyangiaceae bacterium]